MAFTQAQLQTEIDNDTALGNCVRITRFDATSSASYTDVGIQNLNKDSSVKTGMVQIAQSNTAAQALTALKAGLTR